MGIWRRREGALEQGAVSSSNEEIERGDELADDDRAMEVEIMRDGEVKAPLQLRTAKDGDGSDAEEEDWEFAIVLEGHDSEVKNVAYSPSGQFLASCSRDKSIWIWEEVGEEGEDEFETIAVLQEHTADVKCVCWRKDDGNGEVLASASYDDTIRLWKEVDGEGEWESFAVLEGHEGTVWGLDWEPEASQKRFDLEPATEESEAPQIPRLMSCSADTTIRVWTLPPSPPPPNRPSYFNPSIPSTMRPGPVVEKWVCTATLPKVHDLPIYSISWSKNSGRVVSTGSDGKVAIYEERTKGRTTVGGEIEREWIVLAVLSGGHGPYEINHATWCTRFDAGKKEGEEIVITSGDDGVVKAWAIDEGEVVATVIGEEVTKTTTLEEKVDAVM